MAKCKVTVLRKAYYPDLAAEYCAQADPGACPLFAEGDEFVFERGDFTRMRLPAERPFCSEAWQAIDRYIYAAIMGGPLFPGWMKEDKVFIACCSDGVRPVTFKIERID